MFGYVRPLLDSLTEEERTHYQAAYCGLCHSLEAQCGVVARFILNYDFLFLAMLLEEAGETGEPKVRRCAAHPVKGRLSMDSAPATGLCAQESVILAYHKLQDGIADEGFFAGCGYRAAALGLRVAYRRAQRAQKGFDDHVRACLSELAALEGENSPKLDRVADSFARLLPACAPSTGADGIDRPRQQLLYHLGRWVYLVDALDDLEEDTAKGRYNPLAARFGGTVDKDYLTTTLTHSLSLCQSAFQLLPENRWHSVLENILYLGLPNVQRLVLAGKWKKSKTKAGESRP